MTPPLDTTVLIVDDEPAIRDFFSRALELAGYVPLQAQTAEQALRMIDGGVMPSAVLLDLKMPGIGGLGFLLRLRSNPRYARIPVAIVTGDCLLPHTVQVAASILDTRIHYKPMTLEDLLTLTDELLRPTVH